MMKFLSFLILSVFAGSAFGAGLDAAKAEKQDAYTRFYEALKEAGDFSEQTVRDLHSQIIRPATHKYSQEKVQLQEQSFPTKPPAPIIDHSHDAAWLAKRKAERAKFNEGYKEWLKNKKLGLNPKNAPRQDGKQPEGSRGGRGVVQDTGPARPEVVLDGRGVVKEIEFSGPAKRSNDSKLKPQIGNKRR